MKRIFHPVRWLIWLLVWPLLGMAAENGTASEAQVLVGKAVAYLKANGKDKALAEFNNPKGQFVDRDLYVFVLDKDGVTLANGVNPKIVGKNVSDMKDQDGKFFIKDLLGVGNGKGSGWVDYHWPDPVSKKVRPKSTYVEKSGDWFICSGVYK
jgi:signal transduction histidine kinase